MINSNYNRYDEQLATCRAIRDQFSAILDNRVDTTIRCFTDSEYNSRMNGQNLMIGSTVFFWEGITAKPLWLEHHDFKRQRPCRIGEQYPEVIVAKPHLLDGVTDSFTPTRGSIGKSSKLAVTITLEISFYFAPADLLSLFPVSDSPWLTSMLEQNGAVTNKDFKPLTIGYIEQDDVVFTIALKVLDIAKEGPPGGLKKLVEGVGLTMSDKNLMDDHKTDMATAYMTPALQDDFLVYAEGDTLVGPQIHKAHQQRFIALADSIGLTDNEPSREYSSVGSMVSELTLRKLKQHCQLDDGTYPWELFTDKQGEPRDIKWLLKFASVERFAKMATSDKAMLAIVNGGLARNLQPEVVNLDGFIGDFDVSGAYARCQTHIDYCIGIPHTYGLHDDSKAKPITLGRFLAKHNGQLLDRKWVVQVTGRLKNHNQCLVPSKLISKVQLASYSDSDSAKVPGDFAMLAKQIVNGVITSDILAVLKHYCKQHELIEWMGLTVGCAAWYPASHQAFNPEEWRDMINQSSNTCEEVTTKNGNTYWSDTRSKAWYAMPLADIVGVWSDDRDTAKANKKKASTPTDKVYWDGIQNALKLGNNACYGVQSSPIFPIANIVVANNITALCRSVVWLSAVAGNGQQIITDGFCYNVNAVMSVKDASRVNMDTVTRWLSAPDTLNANQRKAFRHIAMGGVEWGRLESLEVNFKGEEKVRYSIGEQMVERWEEQHVELDDMFTKHVKAFCKAVKDSPLAPLDVLVSAHKHVYATATFHSQTNYSFTRADGKDKTKARGHQLSKGHYEYHPEDDAWEIDTAPYSDFIRDLKSDSSSVPLPKPRILSTLVKINHYNNHARSPIHDIGSVMPGDSISKQVWIRPISLSPFLFRDTEQRDAWVKRADKLKSKTGWGLEQYFMTTTGTLDYQKAMKQINKAVWEGQRWIVDTDRNLDGDSPVSSLANIPLSCPRPSHPDNPVDTRPLFFVRYPV